MASTWCFRRVPGIFVIVFGLIGLGPGWTAIALMSDPPIAAVCAGATSGTTFTLSADCDTTAPLTVPDGMTIDGAGHTITAHDPPGGFFSGGVITNAGTVMDVQNVIIKGTGFAFNSCAQLVQTGIFFDDAGGAVSNVTVEDITEHTGCNFGLGIRANALAGIARTVTITGVRVTGYQKGGLVASGMMTMKVSNAIVGPPDGAPGRPAQNGVQFSGGATGSVANSTVVGAFFPNAATAGDGSRAFLLFGAQDVTLTGDTITGAGNDFGVSAVASSTGIVLDHNDIARQPPPPGAADRLATGVEVDGTSNTTLVCNMFDGWRTNMTGTTQAPCPTPTIVPTPTPTSPGTPTPTSRTTSLPAPPQTGAPGHSAVDRKPLPLVAGSLGVGWAGLLLAVRWRRRGRG